MKDETTAPNVAFCGSEGIWMLNGPPKCDKNEQFQMVEGNTMKTMAFSPNGEVFAYCDGEQVAVVCTKTWSTLFTVPRPRTYAIEFSPLSSFVLIWQNYIVTKNIPANTPNMQIYNVKTHELVSEFIHKSNDTWSMQWLEDESLCARIVSNEVHFYANKDLKKIVNKCHIEKMAYFSMACSEPNLVTYVPSVKAAPCKIRLQKYPFFSGQAIATKSFYKADKVEACWNPKGTSVLVLSTLESSTESYYGEQGLYYMDLKGETSKVDLAKKGPIYSMKWNPDSTEFCIVYGYIPSKVTLYNLKCDPVFDFGTGPRNICEFNPQGNILCIAGFGNLPGKMEFWDLKKKKLINTSTSTNSTTFEWCPDGEHVLTATTAPRLRIDNGFKIWHYSGIIREEGRVPDKHELWMARWQPAPALPTPVISYTLPANTKRPDIDANKKKAYVPPAARGKILNSVFKTEYEPAQNLRNGHPESMSKTALKNKKKRENKAKKNKDNKEEEDDNDVTETRAAVDSTGDPDKDKKIRTLNKKIEQIEKLKKKQSDGIKLEKNQIEKITKLDELNKELSELQL